MSPVASPSSVIAATVLRLNFASSPVVGSAMLQTPMLEFGTRSSICTIAAGATACWRASVSMFSMLLWVSAQAACALNLVSRIR